jgi:hypothetical protein
MCYKYKKDVDPSARGAAADTVVKCDGHEVGFDKASGEDITVIVTTREPYFAMIPAGFLLTQDKLEKIMSAYLQQGRPLIGQVSDGYHTFDELYEHRIVLFLALCRGLMHRGYEVWRSQKHADGSEYEGWFIMGIHKNKGSQISYHLPLSKWEAADFAETLDNAPEWDGHSPADVLDRNC